MGRHSVEHKELANKRILTFLLERKTCAARLKAVTGITESLLKCRSTNGDRKKKYREELANAHKVLCCKATDLEEFRQKNIELDSKYEQSLKRNSELADRNVRLLNKLRDMEYHISNSNQQREMRIKAEEDCGRYLDEKRKTEEENRRLKEKIAAMSQTDQVSSVVE